jgi:lipopolysaccharide/colanic/teichoic acid biosynthesis glycosyltransferase
MLSGIRDDVRTKSAPKHRGGASTGVRPASYLRLKRVIDLTLCTVLLPLAVPVIGVCAALIWIKDPGPVLFRQMRTGRGGHRFKMYKLRTMVLSAEELKAEYANRNELAWPDFKIANDPRVTPIGKFLRQTSLDELPQLFNVFKGDMSLVGPRPTSFDASTYALWQTERLEALPGITGLWQTSGRSDVGFDDRVRLDVAYIKQRSTWLDLLILLRTANAVVRRRGAY